MKFPFQKKLISFVFMGLWMFSASQAGNRRFPLIFKVAMDHCVEKNPETSKIFLIQNLKHLFEKNPCNEEEENFVAIAKMGFDDQNVYLQIKDNFSPHEQTAIAFFIDTKNDFFDYVREKFIAMLGQKIPDQRLVYWIGKETELLEGFFQHLKKINPEKEVSFASKDIEVFAPKLNATPFEIEFSLMFHDWAKAYQGQLADLFRNDQDLQNFLNQDESFLKTYQQHLKNFFGGKKALKSFLQGEVSHIRYMAQTLLAERKAKSFVDSGLNFNEFCKNHGIFPSEKMWMAFSMKESLKKHIFLKKQEDPAQEEIYEKLLKKCGLPRLFEESPLKIQLIGAEKLPKILKNQQFFSINEIQPFEDLKNSLMQSKIKEKNISMSFEEIQKINAEIDEMEAYNGVVCSEDQLRDMGYSAEVIALRFSPMKHEGEIMFERILNAGNSINRKRLAQEAEIDWDNIPDLENIQSQEDAVYSNLPLRDDLMQFVQSYEKGLNFYDLENHPIRDFFFKKISPDVPVCVADVDEQSKKILKHFDKNSYFLVTKNSIFRFPHIEDSPEPSNSQMPPPRSSSEAEDPKDPENSSFPPEERKE